MFNSVNEVLYKVFIEYDREIISKKITYNDIKEIYKEVTYTINTDETNDNNKLFMDKIALCYSVLNNIAEDYWHEYREDFIDLFPSETAYKKIIKKELSEQLKKRSLTIS